MQNKARTLEIRRKWKRNTRINQRRTQRKVYASYFPPFSLFSFALNVFAFETQTRFESLSEHPLPTPLFLVYKKRDSKLQIHQETFRPPLYPIPYSCPPYDGQHPSLTMSSRGPRLSQEHSDNHVNDALYRLTC